MAAPIRRPCNSCPWRKDVPIAYWHPNHFTSIYTQCQDDGMHVMLCHGANRLPEGERSKLICQGWVRVVGFDSVGVRIACINGNVTLAEVNDTEGPELFDSFESMMEANGVEIPKRNRWLGED